MSVIYRLHRNGDITETVAGHYNIDATNAAILGKKQKYFGRVGLYRKLSGVACELWDTKVNKLIFVTLTTKDHVEQSNLNKALSNFLDNLKKRYSLRAYLWVCELQARGAPHYHVIMDIPRFDVKRVNLAWCRSFEQYSRYSSNALRLGGRDGNKTWSNVVKSRTRVVKYICKYISKTDISKVKNYGFSKHLVCEPLTIDELTTEDILQGSWLRTVKNEYSTVYYTKNSRDIYGRVSKNIEALRG